MGGTLASTHRRHALSSPISEFSPRTGAGHLSMPCRRTSSNLEQTPNDERQICSRQSNNGPKPARLEKLRMSKVFISYRRDDAAGYAGRLEESLEHRLGPDQRLLGVHRVDGRPHRADQRLGRHLPPHHQREVGPAHRTDGPPGLGSGLGVVGSAMCFSLTIFKLSATTKLNTFTKLSTFVAPNFCVKDATSAFAFEPASTPTSVVV